MIIRKLTKEEVAAYKAPFPTASSRKPVAQFPLEVPFSGKPAANHATQVYN
jgi:haloalkane dehalogenase